MSVFIFYNVITLNKTKFLPPHWQTFDREDYLCLLSETAKTLYVSWKLVSIAGSEDMCLCVYFEFNLWIPHSPDSGTFCNFLPDRFFPHLSSLYIHQVKYLSPPVSCQLERHITVQIGITSVASWSEDKSTFCFQNFKNIKPELFFRWEMTPD